MFSYAELDCLSNFSFLRGASHPEELIRRASSLGYQALALSDECSVSAIPRAHAQARRQGLHLIVGSRFRSGPGELIVLVRNAQAYANLCALISLTRQRAGKGGYHFQCDDILNPPAHLAHIRHLPQCLFLYKPDYNPDPDTLKAHVQPLSKALGGRLWMGLALPLYHADARHRQTLLQCALELGLPVAALGQVEMHKRSRQALHDILAAIRLKKTMTDCGLALRPNAEHHLRSRLRLANIYPADCLQETIRISQQCSFSLDDLIYRYPHSLVPPGMTPAAYLRQETLAGARERYPSGLSRKLGEQIDHELALIAELGYEAYFLTVYDIVQFARSRDILCQGRGSAANSAVCYCLGITEVDPDSSNLLFARFISRERNEPPDIDVDFEHHRREEVIQYIYRKYGPDHAALTAVVITYRIRSALRDIGKALGLDSELIEKVCHSCRYWNKDSDLSERIAEQGGQPEERRLQLWARLARELIGFPRHLSQHPGGFVISRQVLSRLVPIENAAMPGRSVLQWDKTDLDALGILKIDILALGMLSVLRRSLELMALRHGRPFRLQDIPVHDEATFEMIRKADTVGVFQIESRAQMSMLPRLRPTCFYDLVIQIAIVRPGPIQGGMVHPYLERRQNPKKISWPGAGLESILARTLGVIIFQEQAMQVAMTAAGFSADEADQLRRSMAAWQRHSDIPAFRNRLVSGMIKNGHDAVFAENLYQQLEGFGEYGFPESHAASFARLAWFSAWLKCHEPAVFLCALLNSQPVGFYTPGQLIQDARRHGVRVLPADVSCSHFESHLEFEGQNPPGVRLGLNCIRHVSAATACRIETARKQAPFRSVDDLSARAALSSRETILLAQAGALESIAGSRPQALWQATKRHSQDLLKMAPPIEQAQACLPGLSEHQAMISDYASMGFTLGRHPLSLLREQLRQRRFEDAQTLLRNYPDRRLARACGLVVQRQRPMTAKGTLFLTLEDETGNVNVIIRPWLAQKQRQIMTGSRLLGVYGRWQYVSGIGHLIASRLVCLDGLLPDVHSRSRDYH